MGDAAVSLAQSAQHSNIGTRPAGGLAGLSVTNIAGRFVWVDQTYCEIVGYSQRELVGRTFQHITHPDDFRQNWRFARRMIAGELQGVIYEKRYVHKSSGAIWVRNNVCKVSDSDGRRPRFIALTERIDAPRNSGDSGGSALRRFRLISRTSNFSDENERRQLAADLHGTTSQLLGNLVMSLMRLQDSHLKPRERDHLVQEALAAASDCSLEVRRISHFLDPRFPEEYNLTSALQEYTEGFCRRTGTEIHLKLPPALGRLPGKVEVAIFQIVQEILVNCCGCTSKAPSASP